MTVSTGRFRAASMMNGSGTDRGRGGEPVGASCCVCYVHRPAWCSTPSACAWRRRCHKCYDVIDVKYPRVSHGTRTSVPSPCPDERVNCRRVEVWCTGDDVVRWIGRVG